MALAQGDGATALEALDRAIAAAPEATRLHHPRGLALRILGRTEEARAALTQAGTVGVACPDPWWEGVRGLVGGARLALVRGRQALAAQRPADALAAFDQALAADPESSAAAVGRAAALVALDRVEDAAAWLVDLVTRHPDNAEAWYNLGILAGRQGQIESSVGALRRAVALRPDDLEARLRLAEALRAGGAGEEAMLELGLAELANPREPAPALLASRWLAEDGRWDAAIERLERAIARGASTPTVEVSLARLLVMHPDPKRRDPQRAEPLVRAAIGILPDEVLRESLMMVLQAAGRCDEAGEQATLLRGPEVGEQVRAQCELARVATGP
jgi:Flp pilus assembly protein TadD